jgi:hypothetical protein
MNYKLSILFFLLLSNSAMAGSIAFKGEMDTGKELKIDLEISCNELEEEGEVRTGVYMYEHIGKGIPLTGFLPNELAESEATSIYLEEKDSDRVSGIFILEWNQNNLQGYWTNFKKKYAVTLQPGEVLHFYGNGDYSSTEFSLFSVAKNFYYSDLYLSFGKYSGLPVGWVPNCYRDGQVEMAWLQIHEDESFTLEIREEFWGSDGERYSTYKFDKNGQPLN